VRPTTRFPTLLSIAVAACSCSDSTSSPPPGPPWFEECAVSAGLEFTHVSGHDAHFYMPEIMGGGAALFDMDGDGDLDAYLVQSGSLDRPGSPDGANRLYRNDGQGSFTDVTEGSGADDTGYGMGVAAGDFDGDGNVDLYVTNVGPNRLLQGDGTGHFEDVTDAAGVGDPGWGTSAAFFDADRDGDLDIFVVNYLIWSRASERECLDDENGADYCSPQIYNAPAPDVLFVNEGNGKFSNASVRSGIASERGTGLGLVCADYDGDGFVDVFVANDGMPDRLWVHRDGAQDALAFEDIGLLAGCALDNDGRAKAGMGVTTADIDDDGDLDLLVGNLNRQSDSVFENKSGLFSDRTARLGLGMVSRPFTRFGLGWVDFDNDGYLDLFEANGRVRKQASTYASDRFAEPNLLLRGRAGPLFTEVLPRGGTAQLLIATSRGVAFGDIDNDGRCDVLVVNRDGPAHLLRNVVENTNGWVTFRLVEAPGRSALGATVTARVGDRTLRRDARSATSYLSASDPRVHFGLGSASVARDVRVRWNDGTEQLFGDHEAGAMRELKRE